MNYNFPIFRKYSHGKTFFKINSKENLSSISVTANDELFHYNKPILTGIDVRSLYCYLLSSENKRDEETWA